MTTTPGYNIRLTIKIATTKAGKQRATYWSMAAMRWLPLRLADAELFLSMDQADAHKAWTPESEVAA